jgi:four helix bundle protein
MAVSHYAELEVWQRAMDLAEKIYCLTRSFPSEQRFSLSGQLQRAAISVPSNIAEGNARDSLRDYARFVSIARGSLAELETQLLLTERLGFGNSETVARCKANAAQVGRMLQGLHSALKRKF